MNRSHTRQGVFEPATRVSRSDSNQSSTAMTASAVPVTYSRRIHRAKSTRPTRCSHWTSRVALARRTTPIRKPTTSRFRTRRVIGHHLSGYRSEGSIARCLRQRNRLLRLSGCSAAMLAMISQRNMSLRACHSALPAIPLLQRRRTTSLFTRRRGIPDHVIAPPIPSGRRSRQDQEAHSKPRDAQSPTIVMQIAREEGCQTSTCDTDFLRLAIDRGEDRRGHYSDPVSVLAIFGLLRSTSTGCRRPQSP